MNQALLGLSPNIPPGPKEGDLAHDMTHEAKRMHTDKGLSSVTKVKVWCGVQYMISTVYISTGIIQYSHYILNSDI